MLLADDVVTCNNSSLLPAILRCRKSPNTVATEETNAKPIHQLFLLDKAKIWDVIAGTLKTGPSAKTDGADTTTTSTATIKTISLADQDTPNKISKPVSNQDSHIHKETADYTETTTETVNKTTVVESDKRSRCIDKKKSKEHPISSLLIDKSSSMDSHIKDTMKNIETLFVIFC